MILLLVAPARTKEGFLAPVYIRNKSSRSFFIKPLFRKQPARQSFESHANVK